MEIPEKFIAYIDILGFKKLVEAAEAGTPFVEVDRSVCDYVSKCGDWCVKEMFSRCVKDDGELVALFPFKGLERQLLIASFRKFDVEKERQSNERLRMILGMLKERVMSFVDPSNPDAVRKAEHYIRALDSQLQVCDKTDETITLMDSPARPL